MVSGQRHATAFQLLSCRQTVILGTANCTPSGLLISDILCMPTNLEKIPCHSIPTALPQPHNSTALRLAINFSGGAKSIIT